MLKVLRGQRLPRPDILPTPSFGINYVLGGGLWTGRISTFWGNFSSGKTTFALMTMAEAQKKGYTAVIIDAEGTYTDEYAEKCGLDIDNRILIRETIVENVLKEIVPMMKATDEKYVFLVDSMNSMFFENFNKEADGGQQIGSYARVQKYLTAKFSSYIHMNMAVIYIAQQSLHFSQMGAYAKANIGNYVDHMSTNVIRLFSSSAKTSIDRDDDGKIIDQEITWTADKSKQSAIRGISGSYWWNPEEASFNHRKEIFHYAVKCGVIHKGGAWFTFGDKKCHGEAKLFAELTDEDWEIIGNSIFFVANEEEGVLSE